MADLPKQVVVSRTVVLKVISVLSLCVAICGISCFSFSMSRTVEAAGDSSRQFSAEYIRADILKAQSFGNRMTWDKQWQTARWLEESFRSIGISATLQSYDHKGKSWPNLVAEIPGTDNGGQKILAIAHLDSINENKGAWEAPGGDDNGSGMAVMLELARNLRNIPLDRTVTLCIFSNEEQGRAGSSAFAKEQRKSDTKIKAVINIDTLGYNRPRVPLYPQALLAFTSWRKKYSVSKVMLNNFVKGFTYGDNALLVAGRPGNAKLVDAAARTLGKTPGLNVRPQVKDDCG